MKIAPLVAQHIGEVVHDNWTDIYLDDVISDITYEEAIALPAGATNSIAMLVNHLGFYNNIVMERLLGTDPVIDDTNGFNISVNSNEDWQRLKASVINSFKALADYVKALPDEKIFSLTPNGHSTFYKTLHGISEHAHYHLGQIVLLKKMVRHNYTK